MTREEAIKWIEYHITISDYAETDDLSVAFRMAIEALSAEHCEDTISRQMVKDKYRESFVSNLKDDDRGIDLSKYVEEPYRAFCEFMDSIPPVTPKQKTEWIPVSDYGYPNHEDEYKHFITVDNNGEITIQEFLLSLDEEPQPYFTGMRNIVAYMPLPEVCKEK